MALKATRLIREGERLAAAGAKHEAAALFIQARDWAEKHYQHRLAATARRLLAENYVRRAS